MYNGFYDAGISLVGAGSGNVIAGNRIGANATGDTAQSPPVGISVSDTSNTVIGDNVSPPGHADPAFGNEIIAATDAGIKSRGHRQRRPAIA